MKLGYTLEIMFVGVVRIIRQHYALIYNTYQPYNSKRLLMSTVLSFTDLLETKSTYLFSFRSNWEMNSTCMQTLSFLAKYFAQI